MASSSSVKPHQSFAQRSGCLILFVLFVIAMVVIIAISADVAFALLEISDLRSQIQDLEMNSVVNNTANTQAVPVSNNEISTLSERITSNVSVTLTDYVDTSVNLTATEVNKLNSQLLEMNSIVNATAAEVARLSNQLLKVNNDIGYIVFASCAEVYQRLPSSPAGHYLVRLPNTSVIHMYCHNSLTCGGITGGWRRIAYTDASSNQNLQCPPGFYPRSDPRSCARPRSGTCDSSYYFSDGHPFSHVCGRIRASAGSNTGNPDCFLGTSRTIDENYVDGVSLTYGNASRIHIWSFGASGNTPCETCNSRVPSFVGQHFSTDIVSSGSSSTLWDGQNAVAHLLTTEMCSTGN